MKRASRPAIPVTTTQPLASDTTGARVAARDSVATPSPSPSSSAEGLTPAQPAGSDTTREVARATARDILNLAARPFVVAVDVPSGIDADTGAADQSVLPADLTVTFGALKRGLTLDPARSLAGRIVVADIGLGLRG